MAFGEIEDILLLVPIFYSPFSNIGVAVQALDGASVQLASYIVIADVVA